MSKDFKERVEQFYKDRRQKNESRNKEVEALQLIEKIITPLTKEQRNRVMVAMLDYIMNEKP